MVCILYTKTEKVKNQTMFRYFKMCNGIYILRIIYNNNLFDGDRWRRLSCSERSAALCGRVENQTREDGWFHGTVGNLDDFIRVLVGNGKRNHLARGPKNN